MSHFLYPFIYQWTLGCFRILVIVNNDAMDIGMHISFQISVFVYFGKIQLTLEQLRG